MVSAVGLSHVWRTMAVGLPGSAMHGPSGMGCDGMSSAKSAMTLLRFGARVNFSTGGAYAILLPPREDRKGGASLSAACEQVSAGWNRVRDLLKRPKPKSVIT